jgi:hemoglobin
MKTLIAIALVAAGCGGTAAQTSGTTPAATGKSLYERMGGKEAITTIVDKFVANIIADDRVNARFTNIDVPHFKAMLVDQICEASGGPCKYAGKDMKTAHTGMNITEADFNAMGEDMGKALAQANIGKAEQDQLIGGLLPMKSQIIGQ